MDDANIPSLLALPYLGFVTRDSPAADRARYACTRRHVLRRGGGGGAGAGNPYFFAGTAGEGVGGPHVGYGAVWPMAVAVRALTAAAMADDSDDGGATDEEAGFSCSSVFDFVLLERTDRRAVIVVASSCVVSRGEEEDGAPADVDALRRPRAVVVAPADEPPPRRPNADRRPTTRPRPPSPPDEIADALATLTRASAGTGFTHESFDQNNVSDYTRPWFAWANSLVGEVRCLRV